MSKWIKRESIRQLRNEYFVEYKPGDRATQFALVTLTFSDITPNIVDVKAAMEMELDHWLRRFSLPLMVFAWNNQDDMIRVNGESTLMGFISSAGDMVTKWGTFDNAELPSQQLTEEHRAGIYKDIPSTIIDTDARKAEVMREARRSRLSATIIFTLIVVVPLLFEAIALGWSFLGTIVGVVSFIVGVYKAAKKFGWIKQSQYELDDEERERKMRHYYYHCEKNPQGFARLKIENFDRENAEKNRREFEQLKAQQPPKHAPPPRT